MTADQDHTDHDHPHSHDHTDHDHSDSHDHERPDEDWRATLRDRGFRLTPQRELILAAVETLGHATPDEVLAQVRKSSEAINLSTVYRTLEVLESVGLVRHAHLSDRAATYHSVTDREHFHLVCRKCGRIESVDPSVAAPLAEALTSTQNFDIDMGHLVVFGSCVQCGQSGQSGQRSQSAETDGEGADDA